MRTQKKISKLFVFSFIFGIYFFLNKSVLFACSKLCLKCVRDMSVESRPKTNLLLPNIRRIDQFYSLYLAS